MDGTPPASPQHGRCCEITSTLLLLQPLILPFAYNIPQCQHCAFTMEGRGSSILLHSHKTDDPTPTVSDTGISAAHAAAIFITCNQGLTKHIHNKPHTQICQFINFLL